MYQDTTLTHGSMATSQSAALLIGQLMDLQTTCDATDQHAASRAILYSPNWSPHVRAMRVVGELCVACSSRLVARGVVTSVGQRLYRPRSNC